MTLHRLRASNRHLTRDRRWLTTAWVVLLFISSFRFSGFRDPALAASGVASVENAIEVLAYSVIAALVIKRWYGNRIPMDSSGIRLLMGLGALAMTSALWSRVPLFSLVRGSQVVVLAMLTAYTSHVWNTRSESEWPEWSSIWAAILWITCIVSGAGLLLSSWIDSRFTWPGTHPGATAGYLGVAALVALVMLMQKWEVSSVLRRVLPILVIALVILIVLTGTRTMIAAFITALPVVILTSSFASRGIRALLGGFFAYVLAAVMLLWPERLVEFVLRGGSVEQLSSLTGRTELWQYALEALERSPWFGFGYGSGRVVLTERIPWSGTGHNLWIEAGVSLGIVGAVLVTLIISWLFVQTFKNRHSVSHPGKTLVPTLAVFLTVGSVAGPTIALPGFLLTVAGLLIACESTRPTEPTLAVDLECPAL